MNYLNIGELKRLKDEGMYDEGGKHARLREGATITIEQGFLGFTANDNGKFSNRDLEPFVGEVSGGDVPDAQYMSGTFLRQRIPLRHTSGMSMSETVKSKTSSVSFSGAHRLPIPWSDLRCVSPERDTHDLVLTS